MQKAANSIKAIWEAALDIIFPRRCLICGAINPAGEYKYVCPDCINEVHVMRGGHCLTCAEIVGAPDMPNIPRCGKCSLNPPKFNRSFALCIFDGAAREMIHGLKYKCAPHVLKDMSAIATKSEALRDFLKGSVLVPVPIHGSRLAKRKYNQSDLIAKMLVDTFPDNGMQIVRLLKRVKKTTTQTKLDRESRAKNMRGAFKFAPSKRGKEIAPGARIVLVDDVMTTTATLSECAYALKKAGFKHIDAFAFAKKM